MLRTPVSHHSHTTQVELRLDPAGSGGFFLVGQRRFKLYDQPDKAAEELYAYAQGAPDAAVYF